MWEISWQNIQMMLCDMPFTDYSSIDSSTGSEEEVIEVTNIEEHKAAIARLKAKTK